MSDKLNISIVNYGVGNIHNLVKAFVHCGTTPHITEESSQIKNSDAIILPGVGAFEAGMKGLDIRNLTNIVKKFAQSGKPVLGICLGAQLLFTKGYEFGEHEGLDIVQGEVVLFPDKKVKLPHIGWNKLQKTKNLNWTNSIFNGLTENSEVYFVHSFIFKPPQKNLVLAHTTYGYTQFVSAIKKDNVYGLQFHPELSGDTGLSIIKNFIELSRTTKKLMLQ